MSKSNCKALDYAADIRKGGVAENEAIRCLIKLYRSKVENYIVRHQGSREEAEDIFMEGLTETIMKIKKGEFRGESAVPTFLFSICRFIWYNELRKRDVRRKYLDSLWEGMFVDMQLESRIMSEDQKGTVMNLFDQIHHNCRRIFHMRLEGYPFEDIAGLLDKSKEAAMMEASRCRSKLKKLIQQQPKVRELIHELFDQVPV